jgi:hypothetical protein
MKLARDGANLAENTNIPNCRCKYVKFSLSLGLRMSLYNYKIVPLILKPLNASVYLSHSKTEHCGI